MAHENLDKIYSLPAAADFTGKDYYPVVINTSGQVALAGAGVVPHGHIHGVGVKQGEMQRFVHNGSVMKIKAAGTITVGAKLAANAAGYAVGTSGQATAAIALEAGVVLDVLTALFIPGLPATA